MLSCVVCPAVRYFSTLFHKRHDFLKAIEHKSCDLIFSATLNETFVILRRIEHDMTKNVY